MVGEYFESCTSQMSRNASETPRHVEIKAIGGGSGSTESCQANMKDLLTGEQILFTEL